jgi:alkanesulfonate monooxygenase SsuD/methylene tetrahydromethanopterin reductase-like flavin-dependent oxidoreductase (luciferase family)
MKALWTEDEASFHGEHVSLEPSWSWPKPIQQPHPPIIMGASAGPRTIADIVEFCDGWILLGDQHDVIGQIEAVRSALTDAGRDPAGLEISVFGAPTTAEQLESLAAVGVARAIFSMPQAAPEIVLEKMRDRAAFIGRF